MLLAMLGMAVGTGNIWRFPRIVATNGGGAFLIAWVCFLLLWSVPLILVEFAMGKASRSGTVGAFGKLIGRKFAWMGTWVGWCATAIMFYYSVVMGWCIRHFVATLTGAIPGATPEAFWNGYAGSSGALLTHGIAIILGVAVVARGVRGIEKVASILIPSLVVLVIALAIRAVTLPGAVRGLNFLFTPDWSQLLSYRVWLEALTQNAWDTGAGWGLILTYAVYMRKNEDTTLNAFTLGFGNNSMSLLAGIMVLCTVFAMRPDAASEIVGAGNEGLTFIWVPQLFSTMPGGRFFMALFFLALVFAAWTSLISMIELATRVLVDAGVARRRAIFWVGGVGFLAGVPSALSLEFLRNQDFVWGVGLMLSGFFFAFAVMKYGVRRFRLELINGPGADVHIGRWWEWAIGLCLVEAVVLIVWWFIQVRGTGWSTALDPVSTYSIGTVLLQWSVVLVAFLLLNRWLGGRSGARDGPPIEPND
ncbi:MAG: sodium-dependent transporter [Gemmatimonadetes bacterium]|uniref:Sodium-dependent transporter n=1 Tax=Candidatus Kutchimonas denitrificans TaxID=3056748 RepID=A0AAE4ZBR6_9BACT|nr:sodium-dependent transporter [Gemmatimonadota bacterium]NIR76302.1 sodium-dependent transporter [Candidatus Kutchimonas denitrificans]NIS02325.1 sodium-dependent transporter [Gemmatimonadota bacterium]NIT68144.1 sodium-dependent transporter [Gemmatimonadota bacterium]NIU54368.1 sodium-dependent transporter [Gemmatimonadota bacterium]